MTNNFEHTSLGRQLNVLEFVMSTLDITDLRQVTAHNMFFSITAKEYNIDWDQHPFLLKATIPESIEYVKKVINDIREERNVLAQAKHQFFTVINKHYDLTSGDLDPASTLKFDQACEEVIKEYLAQND